MAHDENNNPLKIGDIVTMDYGDEQWRIEAIADNDEVPLLVSLDDGTATSVYDYTVTRQERDTT